MKIQVLDDLQNELNRLFIAGSKFANNDPRITKLIPILDKMGEKAPVMKKLAQQTDALTKSKPEESAALLADTCGLLYSVLNTQLDTDTVSEVETEVYYTENFPQTHLPHSIFIWTRRHIDYDNSGYIEGDLEAGKYEDARIHRFLAWGVEKSETVREVIPQVGKVMIPYILKDFKLHGKKADAERFKLLNQLGYEKMDELIDAALDGESSIQVMVEAVLALGNNPANEQRLIDMLSHKKKEIREAVLISLVKIDSTYGKEKMLEILLTKKYETALKAIDACTDKTVIEKIVAILLAAEEDEKKAPDNFYLNSLRGHIQNVHPEPFFGYYTNMIKNRTEPDLHYYSIGSLHRHLWLFRKDPCVFLFLKKTLEDNPPKNFQLKKEHSGYHFLLTTYFEVAQEHCDEKEIFDLFSAYIDTPFTSKTDDFLSILFIRNGKNLDDRWIDLFIRKDDKHTFARFFELIRNINNRPISDAKLAVLWEYVFKKAKKSATKTDYDSHLIMEGLLTFALPEKGDELAAFTMEYIPKAINESNYSGLWRIFRQMEEKASLFKKPEYIKTLKALLEKLDPKNNDYNDFQKLCDKLESDEELNE